LYSIVIKKRIKRIMDSMKRKTFIIIFFMFFIFHTFLFSRDSLSDIYPVLGNAASILLPKQTGKGMAVSFGGRISGDFSYTMI